MPLEVFGCQRQDVPPSISFSGSGFLATYQLGVAECLLNHAPWILRTAPFVLGASAGSLVAAAVVCEMSIIHIRDEMLHFAKQMKAFTFGPLNPSINVFHWLEVILQKHLPSDAHRLANGRLAVAMTRLPDGKNTVMCEFQSKEDVVQALLCSCFVPGYCGVLPPSFKGVHYVDGGFTSMQPVLTAPSSQTLTVSPFSGEMDICPQDTSSMCDMVVSGTAIKLNMANSLRIINALYPMALETLEQAYHSGYKDAIDFLQSSDLALYLAAQKVSSGPHNCYLTKNWIHQETTLEEEENGNGKKEEETTALTAFTDNRCMQRDSSTEDESMNRNEEESAITEPTLHLDMIQNVLLCNLLIYLGMFGFPMRVFSYLLLPLTLLLCYIHQNMHRLDLWSSQAPVLLFGVWHGLRQFTFFFYSMFVHSIKKNLNDRVMPMMLLLQWLDVQAEYEVPGENQQGEWHSTLQLQFSSSSPSSCPSPSSQPFEPSDPDQLTVLLHLDQEAEGVRRRVPRDHSIMG
ncbi:1-acylglycerol-3-phosphate O-acyltransferase Pnpla3 [Centroberyx gerrardi]